MTDLLEVRGLRKDFPPRQGLLRRARGRLRALDGVDLAVARGETLALVGESGSGKTTLGRCALRLLEPTAGSVRFGGEDLLALAAGEVRRRRRHFQMVFQDPDGSLNPRLRVGSILAEPLAAHGLGTSAERRRRVGELLDLIGLPASAAGRYPHEFSGGQRQRIGIGRALATSPQLLVADEPVSALDVSVGAQIVNLLARLQQRFSLALLFIAHDLALVEQLADWVAVLYLGVVVERGAREAVFTSPLHPYTASLLSAVPVPDPGRRRRRILLGGDPPSAMAPPEGCRFHPRCPIARERCVAMEPPLAEVHPGHFAACFFPGELGAGERPGGGREGNFSPSGT